MSNWLDAPRHKRSVMDRDLESYFPVRLSSVIGADLPPREWSAKYSLMAGWWLAKTVGADWHVVLSDTAPGRPDAMRVLFASFVDARDFVERFEPPIVPIGGHPAR
jgi:hypothetical protein